MSDSTRDCPQCGEPTTRLHEGCCEDCCRENQRRLDEHNAELDHWARLNTLQREEAIRNACR